MTKQVKQLIITGVLIVALVAVILNNLKKKPAKKITPASVEPPSGLVAKPTAGAPVSLRPADADKLQVQKERAKLAWGRDPFRASTDMEYQRATLNLKGISLGQDKKGFAFINNEIVKVGDKVQDYEVVEIEKDKVLLRKGSQSFYLTLEKEISEKP